MPAKVPSVTPDSSTATSPSGSPLSNFRARLPALRAASLQNAPAFCDRLTERVTP